MRNYLEKHTKLFFFYVIVVFGRCSE